MTETHPEYLTPAQIGARLGVGRSTVVGWINRGALPAFKTPGVKGQFRIAASDYEAFVTRHSVTTSP